MRLSRRHICCGVAAAALLPARAWAHRQAQTYTDVRWNAVSGYLQVTHQYHSHDAAMALSQIGLLQQPDLTSLKERARLALYTEAQFALAQTDGTPLPLTLLGAELDGASAYVYQEAKLDSAPKGLIVTCRLLRDIIPEQINDVDIRLGGPVISLQFKKSDGPKNTLA